MTVESLEKYYNTWGRVSAWRQQDLDTVKPDIHPDDFDTFVNLGDKKWFTWGHLVFHCVGINGNFLVLHHKFHLIRVKTSIYQIEETPEFFPGEPVVDPNHPKDTAIVRRMGWHRKEQAWFYYVLMKNKRKSRRYFASDLEKLPPHLYG